MGSAFCLIGIVIILVIPLIIIGNNRARLEREIAQARANYDAALLALRKAPHDSGKRQSALELGRSYANLSRQRKGTTIFDEMALMNDINTASPPVVAPVAAPAPAPVPVAPRASVKERLAQLDTLKADGVVTDDEYQARRAQILADI